MSPRRESAEVTAKGEGLATTPLPAAKPLIRPPFLALPRRVATFSLREKEARGVNPPFTLTPKIG
jgi:hypothetical protein